MTEYEVTISGVFNKKMPPFEFFCQIQVGEKRLRRLWPHQREKNTQQQKRKQTNTTKDKKNIYHVTSFKVEPPCCTSTHGKSQRGHALCSGQ